MNIYKVELKDGCDYDQYDSFIVAAETEEQALATHPSGDSYVRGRDGQWFHTWVNTLGERHTSSYDDRAWPAQRVDQLKVTLLGTAAAGVSGVLLASFNAG